MVEEAHGLDSRLAVVETQIERIRQDLAAIREFIPARMVEFGDRIGFLERQFRSLLWLAGLLLGAALSAVAAHLFK